MAVPKNATVIRGMPLKSGVMLGVSPSSDPTFDVEIARATSSGVYTTLGRLTNKGDGNPPLYTDILPVDGRARSYKARAVKDGWLAGDYTSPITAKPVYLPEVAPNITPMTGKGLGAPLFISTGKSPQFGSAAVQMYSVKTLTVNGFEFWSQSAYAADVSRIAPATTTPSTFFWKSLLPGGSSVSSLRLTYNRPSTKSNLRFRLQSSGLDLVDYTATGAGLGSTFVKTFTSGIVVTAGSLYLLRVQMTSSVASATPGLSVVLKPTLFTYRQPNVGVSL